MFRHVKPLLFITLYTVSALLAGTANAAPRGYATNQSPHEHAFRYARAGEPVRRGHTSERFELRSDDCGGSDCDNPRYRSEIRQTRDDSRLRLNQDAWIGWSFYNATIPSFSRDRALRLVVGQFKLRGENPALIRLIQMGKGAGNFNGCDRRICTRPTSAGDDVVIQLEDMYIASKWGKRQNDGHICRLFNMAANRGRWVDIVMRTNFGTDSNGYLQVWVNGRLKCDYRGQIAPRNEFAGDSTVSPRRGIFSAYTRRWDKRMGNTPKPTLIAYYDEFFVGRSREQVDPAIRAAQRRWTRD